MNKVNIFDFIQTTSSGMTFGQVVLNMAIAFAVAMFIYWVYRKTYEGVLYSKNFNVTLVMVSMVTAMVMMVIGSNLALSLGMVGALSIIRFRSAIKDPKDIGFLFWGITSGLAAGTGSYTIAIAGSLMIAILLFTLGRQWGVEYPYLLIVKGAAIDEKVIRSIIGEETKRHALKMRSDNQHESEIIYEVSFTNGRQDSLLARLGEIEAVKTVNMVSYKGEVSG